MTTVDRDGLAAEAMPIVSSLARRFPRLPAGIGVEDLESAGNEAVVHALAQYDPALGAWRGYVKAWVTTAMRNTIQHARTRRRAELQPLNEAGEELPPPIDPRASDPAAIAEARELVLTPPPRRRSLSVRELEKTLPPPGEVADQVARLRTAMFGAISADDVAAVMQSMVREAKGGDVKAAKLITDLLAPGRSGVTTNQQVIVVQPGDVS